MINELDSIENGYNHKIGGQSQFGEFNSFYNKKHSEHSRQLMSEKAKLRTGIKSAVSKRAILCDTKTGTETIFNSMVEIANNLNVTPGSVRAAHRRKGKLSKRYIIKVID